MHGEEGREKIDLPVWESEPRRPSARIPQDDTPTSLAHTINEGAPKFDGPCGLTSMPTLDDLSFTLFEVFEINPDDFTTQYSSTGALNTEAERYCFEDYVPVSPPCSVAVCRPGRSSPQTTHRHPPSTYGSHCTPSTAAITHSRQSPMHDTQIPNTWQHVTTAEHGRQTSRHSSMAYGSGPHSCRHGTPVPLHASRPKESNVYDNAVIDSRKSHGLHRAKTLPNIRTASTDQVDPMSDVSSKPQTPANRNSSPPTTNGHRKMKTNPDVCRDGLRSKHGGRSKSCERRQTSRRVLQKSPTLTGSRGTAWNFDQDTDSTTSSESMTTGSDDVSLTSKTSAQLYYTTPPKANMVRSSEDKRNVRRSTNHKLEGFRPNSKQRRSASLDCGDGHVVKMCASPSDNLQTIEQNRLMLRASPSDPGVQLRHNGGLPHARASSNKKRGSVSSLDTDGSSPGKTDRKKMSKEIKGYDIVALFDAVEHQDMDAVSDILETNVLDINSVNSEFLTPLDVAVMTNNIPIAKMLLLHGARESPLFQKEEARPTRLNHLVSEAERRVVDLTAAVLNGSSGNTAMSSNQQRETERQLSHWEFRHRLLKRMKAGFDHARCPDTPTNVSLSITSSSSLMVTFGEPLNRNGAVVTKYKVEWSRVESFVPLEGEAVLMDVRYLEHEIQNLEKGVPIYVRVAAMNMKGYSLFTPSNPPYAVPSSWRDVEQTAPRSDGKLELLENLFIQVKNLRPADAPIIKDNAGSTLAMHRKKKGFKNLFSSAPKFHKTLKRGVYLASYFHFEDKLLVTSEEQIPIIEVDENFASPILYLDLYWLMKIACTWDDIKSLRQDMDKSTAEGKVHFRGKLLQAISILQMTLGTHDLGQFFYKPLKGPNGSIILATVNFIHDPKVVTFSSGKWIMACKLQRRQLGSYVDVQDAQDCLTNCINEMTLYHQTCSIALPPGLYLGYLKIHVSVELIRVLVAQMAPNILPSVRVRDCANISSEEWRWVRAMGSGRPMTSAPTDNQQTFQASLATAARKLFSMLEIDESSAFCHRLYDVEVIQLSPHVSFLLVLPPTEEVCVVPGQMDALMEREELFLLPVQVFEMIHMSTYQPQLISRYSRLSSILEMDLILAQQAQREAFSKEELNIAKDRVHQLCNLQCELDRAWKRMRWIKDIITFARGKTLNGGIPISTLLSPAEECSLSSELDVKARIHDTSQQGRSTACDANEISVGKDNRKIAKFYDPTEENSVENCNTSNDQPSQTENSSGILRVYAAYETGLAKGTSVKLHVTPKTTAREVINLVVLNLNQAVINKGKPGPVYEEERFSEFCLVAIIGARERILRDDYQPLKLQNPWTKGRLYVRMRNSLLAAIQQGHATTV